VIEMFGGPSEGVFQVIIQFHSGPVGFGGVRDMCGIVNSEYKGALGIVIFVPLQKPTGLFGRFQYGLVPVRRYILSMETNFFRTGRTS
jgi:hypothetical protein